MELFSEVYGTYYALLRKLLQGMPASEQQIRKTVSELGLPESTLHFLPQLLEQRSWPLFDEAEGIFTSKLEHLPELPLTKLEKSWLKALLQDRRIQLFLTSDELDMLAEKLKDEQALYDQQDFSCFDCCLDGDNYADEDYRNNFRQILAALQAGQTLQIAFTSGKGSKTHGHYVPLQLEYSEKDDKFRAYCAQIRPGKKHNYAIINLARINKIEKSQERSYELLKLEKYFESHRVKQPLIVEISNERNALERFMVEFSAYEKSSEFDEQTEKCVARIYYQQYDETELLIKVLSFGPTIKVTSPPSFIKLIKQRVRRQMDLLR